MKPAVRIFGIALLAALLLAACSAGEADAPARAVEDYLRALEAKDADRLALLSCPDWEDDALLTLDSFAAVEITLRDVRCTAQTVEGGRAAVTCAGSLEATYEGEPRQLDLAGQTYTVVEQAGAWLVCGTQQP